MEKINNFKGVLVYLNVYTFKENGIINITKKSPDVLDYVILDIETDYPQESSILDVAKEIYNNRNTARIWIGTKRYTSEHLGTTSVEIINHIASVKETFMNDSVGKNIWNNCVKGIYLNMERIYENMDYNISVDKNNCKGVKVAKDVSDYVHSNLNLNMLWIPYYQEATEDIVKSMAYMVARTDVFDIVIIQPSYYLGIYSEENLDAVYYSTQKNNICYRNGSEIFPRTHYSATVGFEMEFDNKIPGEPYNENYNKYVNKFKNLENAPMCFYAGSMDVIAKRYAIIEDFYGVYGDADGDGTLTANDAAIVLQYVLDGSIPERITYMCDVNGDNIITAEDSSLILKKVIDDGFIFPIVDAAFGS